MCISTHAFSQSVKDQYNNAVKAESNQKNYSKNLLETNFKNAKVYICSNDFQHQTYLILIGSRIVYKGSYVDWRENKDDHYSLKSTINYFDRDSSVYKRSKGEMSWTSGDYRYTFDTSEMMLYINRVSARSLEKHNCILYKDADNSVQQTIPATKPSAPNTNQPTIRKPTELEKTLLTPMQF